MADFISDEEMAQLQGAQSPDFISDEEMEKMAIPTPGPQPQQLNKEETLKRLLGKDLETSALAGEAVSNLLATYDKYINAPVRQFITEKVTGKEMQQAPTGKEQAAMMGVSTEQYGIPGVEWAPTISPAGAAGMGLEMVQDPLLIFGLGASGLRKGLGALKGAAPIAEAGAEAAAKSAGRAGAEAGAEAAAKSEMKGFQEAQQFGQTESKLGQEATIGGGEQFVKTQGQLFERVPPKSVPELMAFEVPQNLGTPPELARFDDVVKMTANDQIQPLALHREMLENPKSMKTLKAKFDNLASPVRFQLAKFNIGMLNEAGENIKNAIGKLSPVVRSIPDQGRAFVNQVKGIYRGQKEALGPVFEEMKMTNTGPLTASEAQDLQIALIENTKASPLLKVDKKGKLSLLPNNSKTGLSDQEYNALRMVFNDITPGTTFQEVMNQRDRLRKIIDPTNAKAYAELNKARSVMLDKLEDLVSNKVPNMRETFKQYAINEKNLSDIEQIIGGHIEGIDTILAANPENIVKSILSDPNHAQIVKSVIGEQGLNEIVASYLQRGLENSFHSVRGFQPQNFKQFLKVNRNVLERSLPPETLAQMGAWADKGYMARSFLNEVNPSGTAEALLEAIKPGTFAQEVIQKGPVAAVKQSAVASVLNMNKQRQAMQSLNEALSGASAEARAAARAGAKAPAKAALFEQLKTKLPEAFKNMSYEDYLKASGAGAVGRGVLKQEPEEKPKEKPQTGAILEKIKGSKYEQVLQNALQNGGEQSFAAANYVLKNRDQDYRKLFEEV